MKLQVNDIEVFNEMLKSIVKIVPDAQFVVNSEKVEVKVINDSQTIRAFFTSTSLTCDEDVTFCFKDVINLKKSIELIVNIEDESDCELEFNGSFISYANDVKFKMKVVKSDIIDQYITTDISTKLKKEFSFSMEPDKIRQVIQCTNIVNDPDSKVYFSCADDNVICEIDNKTNKMANSVGIPIADDLDGEIENPIIMSVDNFQSFGVLTSDEIEITYTDKNVFEIRSEYEDSIQLYMIATTLKQ